jgi:hypothetical protein
MLKEFLADTGTGHDIRETILVRCDARSECQRRSGDRWVIELLFRVAAGHSE